MVEGIGGRQNLYIAPHEIEELKGLVAARSFTGAPVDPRMVKLVTKLYTVMGTKDIVLPDREKLEYVRSKIDECLCADIAKLSLSEKVLFAAKDFFGSLGNLFEKGKASERTWGKSFFSQVVKNFNKEDIVRLKNHLREVVRPNAQSPEGKARCSNIEKGIKVIEQEVLGRKGSERNRV